MTSAGQSIIYCRLVSHYLCTNKELHVNSVNSKTSRSINGVRGGDVGSNIELFVVGQHQLSCRPSCFNLRGSRTTMEEWSTSRDLNDSISTDKWHSPSKLLRVIQSLLIKHELFSRVLSCIISATLKVFSESLRALVNPSINERIPGYSKQL